MARRQPQQPTTMQPRPRTSSLLLAGNVRQPTSRIPPPPGAPRVQQGQPAPSGGMAQGRQWSPAAAPPPPSQGSPTQGRLLGTAHTAAQAQAQNPAPYAGDGYARLLRGTAQQGAVADQSYQGGVQSLAGPGAPPPGQQDFGDILRASSASAQASGRGAGALAANRPQFGPGVVADQAYQGGTQTLHQAGSGGAGGGQGGTGTSRQGLTGDGKPGQQGQQDPGPAAQATQERYIDAQGREVRPGYDGVPAAPQQAAPPGYIWVWNGQSWVPGKDNSSQAGPGNERPADLASNPAKPADFAQIAQSTGADPGTIEALSGQGWVFQKDPKTQNWTVDKLGDGEDPMPWDQFKTTATYADAARGQGPAQDPNAERDALLKWIQDQQGTMPQMDQSVIDGQVNAARARQAKDAARAMQLAMEQGSRAGVSADQMIGVQGSMAHETAVGNAEQEANIRLQSEVQNFTARRDWAKQQYEAAWAAANAAATAEEREAAREYATRMFHMQKESQKQLMELQYEINSRVTGASVLGGALGLGMNAAMIAAGGGFS